MLAGADENIFRIRVFGYFSVVSRSVLQRHHKSFVRKEISIFFERRFRIRALDKDDDKIYLFWTFSREKGGNIFFIIRFRAVRFDDRNASFPDGFHLRTIGIYHQDLILFA